MHKSDFHIVQKFFFIRVLCKKSQEIKSQRPKANDTDSLPDGEIKHVNDGEVVHNNPTTTQNDIELSCSEANHVQSKPAQSESKSSPLVMRLRYLKERIGSGFCSCFRKREIGEKDRPETQMTCLDLMKSRKMVLYSFIMCSLWLDTKYLLLLVT